ncbi:MAG: OmpA family protein [Myxococcales bacterium]|nr:OmpA family protein [Myxococcales bacterium]
MIALLLSTVAMGGLLDLFPFPDSDGDGVDDRHDLCMTLAETANGYADDDGCPDYLTPLVAVARVDGEPVAAEFRVQTSQGVLESVGGPVLDTALPVGEAVRVSAEHGCWRGHAWTRVDSGIAEIGIDLTPRLDAILTVDAAGLEGAAVPGARVEFVSSPGPGCAPTTPVVLRGAGIRVGEGQHHVRILAPGHAPQELEVTASTGQPARLAVTLTPSESAGDPMLLAEALRVTFATGTSRLTPADVQRVRALGVHLGAHPELGSVVVSGHADPRGSHAANVSLSLARAEAVAAELLRAGLDPARVSVEALGETEPMGGHSDPATWAESRRVEVRAHPHAVAEVAGSPTS